MKSTAKGICSHEATSGYLFVTKVAGEEALSNVSNVQGNFDELQDMYMYGFYKQATYRERYAGKSKSRRCTVYD